MNQENSTVTDATIVEVIGLSRLLGEYGQIMRKTRLPDGGWEPDSHHSFVLASTAYDLASKHAPELDRERLLIYALVHDLPELITGDEPTLTASSDRLRQKEIDDAQALKQILVRLRPYPYIKQALRDYERQADEEAKLINWLDKMITIPTHFFDDGAVLRESGVKNRPDIQAWYQRSLEKLNRRAANPHLVASDVLRLAYQKMHDELLED